MIVQTIEVVAKIKNSNREDVESQFKIIGEVNDGFIIELPEAEKFEEGKKTYQIPAEFSELELFIYCNESGGGMQKRGDATIICGLSGRPLNPFWKSSPNGVYAYFLVPVEIVTVICDRRNISTITIESHRIIRENDIAWLRTKQIWKGLFKNLGKKEFDERNYPLYGKDRISRKRRGYERSQKIARRFGNAARAAFKKSNCYHCSHLHYVQ